MYRVAVRVRLALGVGQDERRGRTELLREVGELVRPAAGIRVQVLDEQHLRQRASHRARLAVRGDGHAFADALGAGRHGTRRALHLDEAHAAAAVRVELVVMAERRDKDAVPGRGVDEQLALRRRDGLPVECELDHCRFIVSRCHGME